MVIKKGKTETEKTISEMKLPKWLDDLITKKWFLYVATALVLVLLIGFSLPASTRDNIASAIFAKTSIDGMDGTGPSGDAGNPPIIGAATPVPVKNKTGNPSGTTAPTAEKEPIKAGKIALEYVIVSENSKISEIKLNVVYISPPVAGKPKYQGLLMIKKEDLPKISSLVVGKTVLSNFRISATSDNYDWGVVEADVVEPRGTFTVSIGTSSDDHALYSGTGATFEKTFTYPILKNFSKAKNFYITIDSP